MNWTNWNCQRSNKPSKDFFPISYSSFCTRVDILVFLYVPNQVFLDRNKKKRPQSPRALVKLRNFQSLNSLKLLIHNTVNFVFQRDDLNRNWTRNSFAQPHCFQPSFSLPRCAPTGSFSVPFISSRQLFPKRCRTNKKQCARDPYQGRRMHVVIFNHVNTHLYPRVLHSPYDYQLVTLEKKRAPAHANQSAFNYPVDFPAIAAVFQFKIRFNVLT